MIQLNCPHCGKMLRIDDRYAGKSGACKQCKSVIQVPIPAEVPQRPAHIDVGIDDILGPPSRPASVSRRPEVPGGLLSGLLDEQVYIRGLWILWLILMAGTALALVQGLFFGEQSASRSWSGVLLVSLLSSGIVVLDIRTREGSWPSILKWSVLTLFLPQLALPVYCLGVRAEYRDTSYGFFKIALTCIFVVAGLYAACLSVAYLYAARGEDLELRFSAGESRTFLAEQKLTWNKQGYNFTLTESRKVTLTVESVEPGGVARMGMAIDKATASLSASGPGSEEELQRLKDVNLLEGLEGIEIRFNISPDALVSDMEGGATLREAIAPTRLKTSTQFAISEAAWKMINYRLEDEGLGHDITLLFRERPHGFMLDRPYEMATDQVENRITVTRDTNGDYSVLRTTTVPESNTEEMFILDGVTRWVKSASEVTRFDTGAALEGSVETVAP